MTTDPCARLADEAQWEHWLEAGVPAELRAHAAGCARCASTLAALDRLGAGLQDLAAEDAAAVEGWDVSDAVLATLDAPSAVVPEPRRQRGWIAGGLALAAAAALGVWLARPGLVLEVSAPAGAVWTAASAAPRALEGAARVEGPGRLFAAEAGPVVARGAEVQARLTPGSAVSFEGPARLAELAGAASFESDAPISMRTHALRLRGAGHIEIADGDHRRAQMIRPKLAAGGAVLVVAVYAGWAHLASEQGEVTGKAPVGLAAGQGGKVTAFELPEGAAPARGDDPATVARARAALAAAGAAKGEQAEAARPSGAYWSEDEQAVRFALEGEVIDAVSGAPVTAFTLSARAEALDGYGDRSRDETVSDSEGRFSIDGLSPGRWRVTARAEGYAPLTQAVDLSDLGADPFLVLPMSSGARLSGQVVDWKQAPVAEAKVGLVECFGRAEGKKGCKIVTTGADGRFVLEGLPGDEAFSVRAEHERLGSTVQPNLRRKEGETEHVLLELSGVLRVFGRVLSGEDSAPQAGVEVVAAGGDVRTKTGPDGAYELFMPLENRPVVRVEVDNGRGQKVAFGSYPERRSSEAIRWVEAGTHVAEIEKDFLLAQDDARIFGRITDSTGAPVAGVKLRLHNTTGWLGERRGHQTFPERTVTDADGRYAIEGVPVKAGYTIAYDKEDGERVDLGYVNVADEAEVEASFTLGDGRIRGRFVDAETGAPFAIAPRDCHGNFAARRQAEGADYFVAPRCLDEGRFELEGLPPGTYRLGSRLVFDDPVLEIEASTVKLSPGQILDGVEVKVRGQQAQTWRLRVLDGQGRFVPSLYLRLMTGNRSYTSNLELRADGTVEASINRLFEQAHIDAQGFESAKVDLRGRDPKAVIEVRMDRIRQ